MSESTATNSTVNGPEKKVRFTEICGLFERLQKTTGNDNKKQFLKDFISKWRIAGSRKDPNDEEEKPQCSTELSVPKVDKSLPSLYPVMRLLLPKLDLDRPAYGIKEHTLAKMYIELLRLGKHSPDANKLLDFRAPVSTAGVTDQSGDFAAVAHHVIRTRVSGRGGQKTVAEVNSALDALSLANVTKDRDGAKKALGGLLRALGPTESKWLIRIILKEIRVGVSEASCLQCLHPEAEDLYSVTSSLNTVCDTLRHPTCSLGEVQLRLFAPFRPMLADRVLANKAVQTINEDIFFVETKMDGERVQLHKRGHQFRYFSRGGKDYTESYGRDGSAQGTLTPHIASKAFAPSVDSIILDGEMMVYSNKIDQFITKGQHVDVKSLAGGTSSNDDIDLQPCFVVFDVLLLNDKVLSGRPLTERLKTLTEVVTSVPGHLHLVYQTKASTTEDVLTALNEAIERGDEGLVLKHPLSMYKPDKRKDSGWYKIKPDYEHNLMRDLDLVIVGGYQGSGRRSNVISHFILAIAESVPTGQTPKRFLTFAKIASGYTDLQLRDLLKTLDPHWTKTQPINVACSIQKPQVWIDPNKSRVVCVRAAEMTVSDKYKAGHTLRFPRLESIRTDKLYHEILTTNEVKDLWNKCNGKLATNFITAGDAPPAKKPRIIGRKFDKPVTVDKRFKLSPSLAKIEVVSDIFNGREICVMVTPSETTKDAIERVIVQNGGLVVQNAMKETFCVVANKLNVRIRNLMTADTCEIVKCDWLNECVEANKMIEWHPKHMIHVTQDTRPMFTEKYGENFEDEMPKT